MAGGRLREQGGEALHLRRNGLGKSYLRHGWGGTLRVLRASGAGSK